jgi:hypothetical protein
VDPAASAERQPDLDRALTRTSHLFADTATLRRAMNSAADACNDITGDYVAVVAGLAVAYAHSRQGHEAVAARRLLEAAHGEPAMLGEARARLEDLDFLAITVRRRADRLLAVAGGLAERATSPAATG